MEAFQGQPHERIQEFGGMCVTGYNPTILPLHCLLPEGQCNVGTMSLVPDTINSVPISLMDFVPPKLGAE